MIDVKFSCVHGVFDMGSAFRHCESQVVFLRDHHLKLFMQSSFLSNGNVLHPKSRPKGLIRTRDSEKPMINKSYLYVGSKLGSDIDCLL